MNLSIIIVIIIVIIVIYVYNKSNIMVEGYWDNVPYDLSWSIYSSLSSESLKENKEKCLNWCKKCPGVRINETCKLTCNDNADIQELILRSNEHTFGKDKMTKFRCVNLFNHPELF